MEDSPIGSKTTRSNGNRSAGFVAPHRIFPLAPVRELDSAKEEETLAHEAGLCNEQDPLLGLLPPPSNFQLSTRHGSAQMPLRSQLDSSMDLRVADQEPTQTKLDDSMLVNFVPQPHFRVQAPTQKIREVATSKAYEPLHVRLERDGLCFSLDTSTDSSVQHSSRYESTPIDRLRKFCWEIGLPISGSRDQLVNRLEGYSIKDSLPSLKLKQECLKRGLTVLPTKKENYQQIYQLYHTHPFGALSLEELTQECQYRLIDKDISKYDKEELQSRLMLYRKDRTKCMELYRDDNN